MGLPDISEICSRSMLRARKRPVRAEVFTSSLTRALANSAHFLLPVLLLLHLASMADGERLFVNDNGNVVGQPYCGKFLTADAERMDISTPLINDNGAVCKWLIQAKDEFKVKLNFSLHSIPNPDGSCRILEFFEPGCDDRLIKRVECGSQNGSVANNATLKLISGSVSSKGRWICVSFKSYNRSIEHAFRSSYRSIWRNISTKMRHDFQKDPTYCPIYNFECKNKVCVSSGYQCDFVNDCGCFEEGCDEVGCRYARTFSVRVTFGVGFPMGFVMMLIVITAGLCIEKRHNWYHIQSLVGKEPGLKKKSTTQSVPVISSLKRSWNDIRGKHELPDNLQRRPSDERFLKDKS